MRRKVSQNVLFTMLMLILVGVSTASACTIMRFSTDGGLLIARNHDWSFGRGLLIVNKRGIEKKGISPIKPAKWVSRFGSVSFVQYGREIPFAGMNEKGLTVDILQLVDARFPAPDKRDAVNAIQWLQFQLDTAESVTEVVSSLQRVRPAPLLAMIEKVHYFVSDANGDAAVIEFLEGKAVVRQGDELSKCALANSCWDESIDEIGNNGNRHAGHSLRRFEKAVQAVEALPTTEEGHQQLDYAFDSLASVNQPGLTQWSLVYAPRERKIWFQTTASPQRRWIDLDDLEFDAKTPVQMLDIDSQHAGDLVPHLQPYTNEANQELVDFAIDRLMPSGLARVGVKQLVLSYPDSTRVVQAAEAE
ncbi:MAG: linear amide C-N hydrolase [Rubripirellula sp.]